MKRNQTGSTRKKKRPYFPLIDVREVRPLDGFKAHFVFSDGTERDIDLDQYIHGGVFEPIRNDPELFRNMFVENGTITWPGEVDIAPDTLYYGDEDPPWVKYDKEQELKAQRAKRAARARTARKSVNGKRAQTTPRARLKKSNTKRPVTKPAAPRKKVLAKKR